MIEVTAEEILLIGIVVGFGVFFWLNRRSLGRGGS